MSHGQEAEPTDLGLICESPMGRQDKATMGGTDLDEDEDEDGDRDEDA